MRYLLAVFVVVIMPACDPFGGELGVDSSGAKRLYSNILSPNTAKSLDPTLSSVKKLHAYARGFEDHTYVMKFNYSTREPVEALVQRFNLKRVSEPEHGVVGFSSESPSPRWWAPPKDATIYSSGNRFGRYITLWDIEASKTVYYQDWST